jgi:hypothetical protein
VVLLENLTEMVLIGGEGCVQQTAHPAIEVDVAQ